MVGQRLKQSFVDPIEYIQQLKSTHLWIWINSTSVVWCFVPDCNNWLHVRSDVMSLGCCVQWLLRLMGTVIFSAIPWPYIWLHYDLMYLQHQHHLERHLHICTPSWLITVLVVHVLKREIAAWIMITDHILQLKIMLHLCATCKMDVCLCEVCLSAKYNRIIISD